MKQIARIEYPRSIAQKIYQASKLNKHLWDAAVGFQADCVDRSGRTLKNPSTTRAGRLWQATALGMQLAPAQMLRPSDFAEIQKAPAALRLEMYAHAVQIACIATISVAPILMGAALAGLLGTGMALPTPQKASWPHRIGSMALQHGILGLPEAALGALADRLTPGRFHRLADACLVAATIVGLPIELARTAFSLMLMVELALLNLLGSALAVAYNVIQWARHRDDDVHSYALSASEAGLAKALREGLALPTDCARARGVKRAHVFDAHADAQRFAYTTMMQPLVPLLYAEDTDAVLAACQSLEAGTPRLMQSLVQTQEYLKTLTTLQTETKKLQKKQSGHIDRTRAFVQVFFSQSNNASSFLNPHDVALHANQFLLRIHPDKVRIAPTSVAWTQLVPQIRELIYATRASFALIDAAPGEPATEESAASGAARHGEDG